MASTYLRSRFKKLKKLRKIRKGTNPYRRSLTLYHCAIYGMVIHDDYAFFYGDDFEDELNRSVSYIPDYENFHYKFHSAVYYLQTVYETYSQYKKVRAWYTMPIRLSVIWSNWMS
jgi:hypothetical protein